MIPYLSRDYLPFQISSQALCLSRICTELKQNRIMFEILNPNENSISKYSKAASLIIRLTDIISKNEKIAIDYLNGARDDSYLEGVLQKIAFNLPSLGATENIFYIQPCFKDNLYTYLCILKEIKKKYHNNIICCGTYFSIERVKKLRQYSFIDYIIDGNLFNSISRVLRGLGPRRNKSTTKINARIIMGRQETQDLNNEPMPNSLLLFRRPKIVPIDYATGCPFNCFFCDYKHFVPTFQLKNTSTLMKEIRFYRNKGIKYFWFHAAAINFREEYLRELCNVFIKNNFNCKWSAPLIPSRLEKSIFNLMHKAGCLHLRIGIESPDGDILDGFNKGVTLESIEETLRNSFYATIKKTLTLMVGLPMEKKTENIRKKRFIQRNMKYIDSITIYPFELRRGTAGLKIAHKLGLKVRKNTHNDNRYLEFDEVNGSKWEEFCERQQFLLHDLEAFLENNGIPHLLPEEYFIKLLRQHPRRIYEH
ncbi:MAG: radical SAM protein [Candidatus Omnitrophota bacterium]